MSWRMPKPLWENGQMEETQGILVSSITDLALGTHNGYPILTVNDAAEMRRIRFSPEPQPTTHRIHE